MAYKPFPDIQQDDGNLCEKDKRSLTQVEVVFRKYYDDVLKSDITAARNNRITAEIDLKKAADGLDSMRCSLVKIEETYDEYQILDYYLASVFDQAADELVGKVASLDQKDQETVKAFNAAHASIQDMKKKVGELKDSASKLEFAMSDPCNDEQMDALKEHVTDDSGNKVFEGMAIDLINCIKGESDANAAFETSVKVAGLHAYLNIAAVKPLAANHKLAAAAFKANIDANTKAQNEEWKKTYDAYLLAWRRIGIKKSGTRATSWKQFALCRTKDFICQPDNNCGPHIPLIENICNESESGFLIACPDEPEPGAGAETRAAV